MTLDVTLLKRSVENNGPRADLPFFSNGQRDMPTIIERLNGCLAGDWADTLANFRVIDVPAEREGPGSLLICESPHIDEVTDEPIAGRYPLRGDAGKVVTKALVQCGLLRAGEHGVQGTEPVGLLVKQRRLTWIRIVNVCELPLQSEAYAQRLTSAFVRNLPWELAFSEWCRLVLAFRTVRELRGNPSEITDPLVDRILDDFRCRLGDLQQMRPALVCGLAARACWRCLGLPEPNGANRVRFVAHPARHSAWFNESGLKRKVRASLEAVFGAETPGD